MNDVKDRPIRTRRLLLRRWTDDDREDFAQISADPEVMRYRLAPLSRQDSDALIDQIEASSIRMVSGCGRPSGLRMVGRRALPALTPRTSARPLAAIDIGWVFAEMSGASGYAMEGAIAAMDFAFNDRQLNEVVSHTAQ